jgi:hypothetical protein
MTDWPFDPDITSDRSPLREISSDFEAPGAPLRFIQAMYAVIEKLWAGEHHLTQDEKHFIRDLYRDLGGTRDLGLQVPPEVVYYLGDQRERDYRLEIVSHTDGQAGVRVIPTRDATNPQARVFHFQSRPGETSGQWEIEGSRGSPSISPEQVATMMGSFRAAIETISAAEKTQLSPGERLFLFHLYQSIGGTRDLGE